MADIEERKNNDGSVTYRVRWRQDGKRPTYTFNTAPDKLGDRAAGYAQRFQELVTMNRDRLPSREQLMAFGLGWVLSDIPSPRTATTPRPPRVMTVAQLISNYLDHLESKTNAPEARTLRQYRGYLRAQIEPRRFGSLDQATCTFEDVDAWQKDCLTTVSPAGRKMLSTNSVGKIRAGLIAPAFKWACSVRSGRLRTLPSPLIDSETPKKVDPQPRDILNSAEEVALFLQAAWKADSNFAAMVAVVAATGLRWEEVTGLVPSHVISARNVLRIWQRNVNGEMLPRTKNGGYRDVPVPEWMMRILIVPRLSATREAVFEGPNSKPWLYQTEWLRWRATRANMATAGLPLHLTHHCLRHTFATWLKSHDLHPQKIDLVLGHSDRSVGRRYNRLTARDCDAIRDVATQLVPFSSWPGPVIE